MVLGTDMKVVRAVTAAKYLPRVPKYTYTHLSQDLLGTSNIWSPCGNYMLLFKAKHLLCVAPSSPYDGTSKTFILVLFNDTTMKSQCGMVIQLEVLVTVSISESATKGLTLQEKYGIS
jgi:hypothetical protein